MKETYQMAKFERRLGLLDATAIVVGSMIGSGIFIAPSLMAGIIASPGIIGILWLVGGLITILGALCYGELAGMFPKAGGQYVFLRESFSPLFGFLYGWTLFLVIQTGLVAAVAVAFAKYLGVFIGGVSENVRLFSFHLLGRELYLNTAQIVAILSIAVLTFINFFGVRLGALIQDTFTFLKSLGLIVLVVAGFAFFRGDAASLLSFESVLPPTATIGLAAALAVALSKALFAYDAWYYVTYIGEEVKNPTRNMPIALGLGTLAVTIIYVVANLAYFYVLPASQAASVADNRIAAAVAHAIMGPAGLFFISAVIMISTFGCNNGLILSGARVFYAMAHDGLFFKNNAKLHPHYHVPTNALIYQGVWASVLTLSGTYSDLLTYTAFASILFGLLTVAGLFALRYRRKNFARPYKVPLYPYSPIIYILVSLAFLIYVVQGDPWNSGKGILIILAGVPVYFIRRYFLVGRINPSSLRSKEVVSEVIPSLCKGGLGGG